MILQFNVIMRSLQFIIKVKSNTPGEKYLVTSAADQWFSQQPKSNGISVHVLIEIKEVCKVLDEPIDATFELVLAIGSYESAPITIRNGQVYKPTTKGCALLYDADYEEIVDSRKRSLSKCAFFVVLIVVACFAAGFVGVYYWVKKNEQIESTNKDSECKI
eukprot:336232_1